MATKPPKKPLKTTSANKRTQPKSTVTPIGYATSGGETHNRGFQTAEQRTEEQVRIRAYELFEERGRHEGHDREDWARAEAEVRAQFQRAKSA
jgi:Protein of unknown function (DUF2934)